MPICISSFPSWLNLRICESTVRATAQTPAVTKESLQVPLPPIHTLSLWSMEMPWFDVGQTYPSPGPPHDATRLPSGSNSRMGGAAAQHSAIGGFRVAPASVRWLSVGSPRWMMNTWSFESTPTPMVEPRIQWLGRGLGQ